ncbi:cytochrome c3 family protein [Dethiobacter alkaliphilus]|nr:cytochrome c3 family protein [Dethiobacter alkaliphilus]
MKKFSLIMVLTMVAMLVFAGYAMAAPTDSLEGFGGQYDGYDEGPDGEPVTRYTRSQDTSPYYNQDGDGLSQGVWDGQNMLDPRLLDEEAFVYEYVDQNGETYEFPVVNANRSGEKTGKWNNFRRNISGQAVHTRFSTNTNSCASCHMTHTAQGANLLFRANNYATCAACHDGSGIAFLNVFKPSSAIPFDEEGKQLGGTWTTSGTFGVDPAMNGSVHLATGDVANAAAPGGNRVGVDKFGNEEDVGDWSADFSCTSCHAAHGSYSFRLLHWNTNNISNRTPEQGGFWFEGLEIDENGNLWLRDPEITPAYGFEEVGDDYMVTAPLLYETFRRDIDSLWIYDANGESIGNGRGDRLTPAEVAGYIDFGAGTIDPAIYDGDISTVTVDVGLVLVVEGTDEDGRYKTGLEYNFFCAACHTDYEMELTNAAIGYNTDVAWQAERDRWVQGRAMTLTGIYSDAHRHTTYRGGYDNMDILDVNGNMMCVSCHFVHGSDTLIMSTADERVIGAAGTEYELNGKTFEEYVEDNMDINTSSALKRHTNMAVCWACHSGQRNDVFVNTDYFWNDIGDYDDTFEDIRGWNPR